MPTSKSLDDAFEIFERHAAAGEQCPHNKTFAIRSETVLALCLMGRILVELFAMNYRVITILQGPHAGASTAPDPGGYKPWRITDHNGPRLINQSVTPTPRSTLGQPSKPRFLIPYAGKER